MGRFEHGSTIIFFAPPAFALHQRVAPGARIRASEPLLGRHAGVIQPN